MLIGSANSAARSLERATGRKEEPGRTHREHLRRWDKGDRVFFWALLFIFTSKISLRRFANGLRKILWSDGHMSVEFTNGDSKEYIGPSPNIRTDPDIRTQ